MAREENMDRFDIWGQVQEIGTDRYLAIAMACPEKEGGETVFSKVLDNRDAAAGALEELIGELQDQLRSAGDTVVAVHELEDNLSVDRPGAWFSGAMASSSSRGSVPPRAAK
jgi:hypothetical protein